MKQAIAAVLGAAVLVAAAAPATTLAAKKKKSEPAPEPAVIESIKGKQYRMAGKQMAGRVTRFADAAGDQVMSAGSPAAEAPEWSDIEAVYVAPIEMPWKLRNVMATDYPRGTAGVFYGNEADWQQDDPGVFVAVKMARKLPADAGGQQVEVGLGGDEAMPVQVDAASDPRAGVERFSLSGIFSNGAMATGSTDVAGREPGDPVEYYNSTSGVFGFYAPKSATWYLIMPRDKDVESVAVTVRSNTEAGEVIDRLELPGGGHFVSLSAPTGGFDKKHETAALDCRSLETFSADSGVPLSDPEATAIRYTAGMDVEGDPEATAAILGPAIEVMGPVDVALSEIGSDAEPLVVEGDLAVAPGLNAVSLTFEAPPGQWTFALADELVLKTPAGQSIIDHDSLSGQAGVRTGARLDGFVAGDLSCAVEGSEMEEPDVASSEEADASAEPADASAEPAA